MTAARTTAADGPAAAPRLSVQLYSVRDSLGDLDATFARLAGLDVRAVEPFVILADPAGLGAALARYGLTAPTAHSPFLSDTMEYEGHQVPLPGLDHTLDVARGLGVEVLVDPMVAPERWRDRSEVDRTADRLNAAAERAASLGMRVGYHNHSFEFHHQIDGRSAYEYFASRLDERVVLELDIFWAAAAGQDVPAVVRRLGRRVRALHVKDGVIDGDPFADGAGYDPTRLDQRPAGQGNLPVEAIIEAAASSEFDVIEFDHVDGDVFDAVDCTARRVREIRGRRDPS